MPRRRGEAASIYHKSAHTEGGVIKPDIVVWHRTEKWAQIIDISVPSDFGLNRAEREKMNKYQDLKDTWNLESVKIIPVIVGATGLLKTTLETSLRKPN